MAPYLFLIVAEVLDSVVKTRVDKGRIKRILLSIACGQQTKLQYIDDTSLTLLREELFTRKVVHTISTFCHASYLAVN